MLLVTWCACSVGRLAAVPNLYGVHIYEARLRGTLVDYAHTCITPVASDWFAELHLIKYFVFYFAS